jgi:hypothetical protein
MNRPSIHSEMWDEMPSADQVLPSSRQSRMIACHNYRLAVLPAGLQKVCPWLRSLEQRRVTEGTQTELPSAILIIVEKAFVEEKMTRAVVAMSL